MENLIIQIMHILQMFSQNWRMSAIYTAKCALLIETFYRLHIKAIEERVPLQQIGPVVLQHHNYVHGGASLRFSQRPATTRLPRF